MSKSADPPRRHVPPKIDFGDMRASMQRVLEGRKDRSMARMLQALKEELGGGLTDAELAVRLQMDPNHVPAVRGRLLSAGRIRPAGRRKSAGTGRSSIVWTAVSSCEDPADAPQRGAASDCDSESRKENQDDNC